MSPLIPKQKEQNPMELTLNPFQVVAQVAVAATPEAVLAIEASNPGAIGALTQQIGVMCVQAITEAAGRLDPPLDLDAIPGVDIGFGLTQVHLGGQMSSAPATSSTPAEDEGEGLAPGPVL